MTRGEKVLNALTIVGYVFVGLFIFVAAYLAIAYAAGYFLKGNIKAALLGILLAAVLILSFFMKNIS